MTEINSEKLISALNNLNERVTSLETKPLVELGGRDRAILDEAAGFFGVHSMVANTIESKANGVTDIDPNTGLSKVEVKRPNFSNVEQMQTGA